MRAVKRETLALEHFKQAYAPISILLLDYRVGELKTLLVAAFAKKPIVASDREISSALKLVKQFFCSDRRIWQYFGAFLGTVLKTFPMHVGTVKGMCAAILNCLALKHLLKGREALFDGIAKIIEVAKRIGIGITDFDKRANVINNTPKLLLGAYLYKRDSHVLKACQRKQRVTFILVQAVKYLKQLRMLF